MSETKGDTKSSIKGLDVPSVESKTALDYYQPIDDKTDDLVRLLLSEETGPQLSVSFDVGTQKLRVYGQPVIMSKFSEFMRSVSYSLSFKEATPLAANIPLKSPTAFLNVWLYINAITTSILPRGAAKEKDNVIVDMWQWIKYLDVNILTENNYEWVRRLPAALLFNPKLMDQGERKDVCDKIKIMLRRTDADELTSMADIFTSMYNICGEPVIAGQYFIREVTISDGKNTPTTVKGSRDFYSGITYANQFLKNRYKITIAGRPYYNAASLDTGAINKDVFLTRLSRKIYAADGIFDYGDTYVIAEQDTTMEGMPNVGRRIVYSGIIPRDTVAGIQFIYDLSGEGLRIVHTEDVSEDIRRYLKK